MTPGPVAWVACCTDCALERSRLDDPAANGPLVAGWSESAVDAHSLLRRANAGRSLDAMVRYAPPPGRRLLDVGCGAGWFLDIARERGLETFGIEPDPGVAEAARANGHDVTAGLFPRPDAPAGSADIVSFNDVLEHLPDPLAALCEAHRLLASGGTLILTLPDRRGAFYRMAGALLRLGLKGPYERLWQRGYESPHLWYFSPGSLEACVRAAGFEPLRRASLPSVALAGLWGRLAIRGDLGWPARAGLFAALAAAHPVIRYGAPSDIMLVLSRKR